MGGGTGAWRVGVVRGLEEGGEEAYVILYISLEYWNIFKVKVSEHFKHEKSVFAFSLFCIHGSVLHS